MKIKKLKKLNSKIMYEGYRIIVRNTFLTPDSKETDYDIVSGLDSVSVLVKNKKHEILLIKQFRPGPEKVLYELPGGGIEPYLSPLANAKKELFEETGYRAKNYKLIAKYIHNPYSHNYHYIYLADNPEFIEFKNGDDTEWIESKFYSIKEIQQLIKSGLLEGPLTLLLAGKNIFKN